MSNSSWSSPVKTQTNLTSSQVRETRSKTKQETSAIITHATPTTTVHPQVSKKKKTKSFATISNSRSASTKTYHTKSKKSDLSVVVKKPHNISLLLSRTPVTKQDRGR
jgi:hypothetical protein